MEGYLVDDIKEYEQLYKRTKDRCMKDWYAFKIRQILERIANLLNEVGKVKA